MDEIPTDRDLIVELCGDSELPGMKKSGHCESGELFLNATRRVELTGGDRRLGWFFLAVVDPVLVHAGPVSGWWRGRFVMAVRLDVGLRRVLESSYDEDLCDIQVVVDPDACWLLRADAFTYGRTIVFATPEQATDLWLLGHEAAHVVQQRRGLVDHEIKAEWQADAAADAVVAGARFSFAAPPAAPTPRVQCHLSWEHQLMGDLTESDMVALAQCANRDLKDAEDNPLEEFKKQGWKNWGSYPRARWQSVEPHLRMLLSLYNAWNNDRYLDLNTIQGIVPWIKVVSLPGTAKGQNPRYVTVGEINALPDYFSRPGDIVAAVPEQLNLVIDGVRTQTLRRLHRMIGGKEKYDKRNPEPAKFVPNCFSDLFELKNLESISGLYASTFQSYQAVLCRNASHFAPFSWYRWERFHLEAREYARQSYDSKGNTQQSKRYEQLALISNGYANHFLQDSFAAGHMINKTLVMQWYVEWYEKTGHDRWFSAWLKASDCLHYMTRDYQKGLHGPGLYTPVKADQSWHGSTLSIFHPAGDENFTGVTDPQTAQDEREQKGRIRRSGMTPVTDLGITDEIAYSFYLKFLNNAVTQLSTNILHNKLNDTSRVVFNGKGKRSRTWGDNTMINSGSAMEWANIASYCSQKAVEEILSTGKTEIHPWEIFQYFPTKVEYNKDQLDLPDWHKEELWDLCANKLFPDMARTLKAAVIAGFVPQLAKRISLDYEEMIPVRKKALEKLAGKISIRL